ncbi:GntR family transcriptional regulator [Mycobacterium sp. IS-1556]|uniref:GntR family transcriptional regulator n=1 Tax=Mycobacterium sp. IS-1556 TaxID=1772276 RepID=UPI0012E39A65|nr:GntR family transcriptional regulator [Mycobacterium sp. IS-1556]
MSATAQQGGVYHLFCTAWPDRNWKVGPTTDERAAHMQSPLGRRSSGELVADHLRRQIITGELRPGQRLTQEDIAAQLGTSRVPVREALVILEQEGWVKMEMHRGGFVLPIQTSVADNAEVWDLVFGLVARRAVERLTPEFDSALAGIAADLTAAEDPQEISALCEHYLDVLFEAASAPAVARTVRRTRATSIDTIFGIVPNTIEISRKGTLAVIAGIRARDSARANSAHAAMQKKCLALLMKAFKDRAQ